jgi:hypothetical protein
MPGQTARTECRRDPLRKGNRRVPSRPIAAPDRLTRLNKDDWESLKAELTARRVRVVTLDLPTSWMMAAKADAGFAHLAECDFKARVTAPRSF